MICSIIVYVIVSLLDKKHQFNLDKMLHRGKYAVVEEQTIQAKMPVKGWQTRLGMTNEFTRLDKILYCGFGAWSIFWFIFFCVVVLYRCFFDISDKVWWWYWGFCLWLNVVLAIATLIWFTFGGMRDLRKMLHRLKAMKKDSSDDGEIVADESIIEKPNR